MQTDVLIIGQGICGTFLQAEAEKAGLKTLVIDEDRVGTASKVAAGLINPVTGRRMVKTWMIDELLGTVQEAYRGMQGVVGAGFLSEVQVVDFFPTPQMRLAFLKRYEEDPSYLELPGDEGDWRNVFNYDFGYGMIRPCYLVDLPGLLEVARRRMRGLGVLREEKFEWGELEGGEDGAGERGGADGEHGGLDKGGRNGGDRGGQGNGREGMIRYRDISARWVIFCDGMESFGNPYFSRLPFAPNKGEALIIEIPELAGRGLGEGGVIFKKGISMAPWRDGLYWVGSSYEWSFTDAGPTELFRQRTEAILQEWLKKPFRTVEHLASVRPATLERRPFVGLHPRYPGVGILNGMGTKGCSLAPFFARQLVEHLNEGRPIQADADVRRFTKVLSRG